MLELAALLQGLVESSPHQPHLDEVVKVTGLKGRVLAIVSETQQLLRLGFNGAVLPQLNDGSARDNRRRGASPGVAEARKLLELVAFGAVISGATSEAEQKRSRLEPHVD